MSQYGTAQYGMATYGTTEHPYTNTPGKIMWLVQVDWDRDGVFGSECEPQTITKVRIRAGRKARIRTDGSGQESPKLETFWIEILDKAQRYDGFNASSPIAAYLGAVGMMVRILAISTTLMMPAEPIFTGVLTALNYDNRTGRTTLSGEGMARWLMDVPVWTPCQPNTGGHDGYFHDDGSTPFPVNYWRGRPDGLTLQQVVALTLAEAEYPFAGYYGDAITGTIQPDYFYMDGSSAWAHLEEITDGFASRLFVLRDGRIFAMDKDDQTGLNAGALVPDWPQERFGIERLNAYESLRNTIKVAVRPHAVTPFKTPYIADYYKEVWGQSGPFAVEPSTTVELDVQYNAEAPSEGSFVDVNGSGYPVNFECWSAADRTGTRMDASGTGQGEFAILWETIDGLQYPYGNNQKWTRVKFRNYSATLTAYFFDAKVMLIGIRETGASLTKQIIDSASVALNGTKTLNINSKWVQTADMAATVAQAYADALATRELSSPATLLYQWSGETLYQNLLKYDLGTHVQFGEQGGGTALANFGMWGRWLVVGREIEWMSADGQDARVKVTYEKRPGVTPVVNERNGGTTTGATPASTMSVSHQVDSHPNRLLVAFVGLRAFQTVTSITRGGQAFVSGGAVQASAGNYPRTEIWYLVAPDVGIATVDVVLSGAEYAQLALLGFYDANQDHPLGAVQANAGIASGPPANLVPAAANDYVVDAVTYSASTLTVGAGQSLLGTLSSDGNWKTSLSKQAGAAPNVVMDWTWSGVTPWAKLGVAIKSASG